MAIAVNVPVLMVFLSRLPIAVHACATIVCDAAVFKQPRGERRQTKEASRKTKEGSG
jgi:hypothetical protein